MGRSAILIRAGVVAGIAAFAASCSNKLEGPQPAVEGVSPGAVCHAQLTTEVVVTGSGLSPLLVGHLKGQRLELPVVALWRTQDVEGAAASGEVIVPDDSGEGQGDVRWESQARLEFDVRPELKLAPGLYDVVLTNANGKSSRLEKALLAVPPPTVTKIEPDVLCGDKDNTWVLTGDFFIRGEQARPKIKIGETTFDPAELTDCRPLPGEAGLEACRTMTVALPADAVAPGNHPVLVENPGPVGCSSTEAIDLTLVPEPTVTTVVADLACTDQGDTALVVHGQGFITVDGQAPKLTLQSGATVLELQTAAEDCAAVNGPAAMVQSCTRLTATIAQGALSPGNYLAKIANPTPVDCSSAQDVRFVVVPQPALTAVAPALGCSAEGERTLTLTGTGFITVDGMAPAVTLSDGTAMATVSTTASDCTMVQGPTEVVQSCATLTATLAQNALPPGPYQVTVKNPAPAACLSGQVGYTVTPDPVVSSVVPDVLCAAEGVVPLLITGQGFLRVAGVEPTVAVGALMPAAVSSGCGPLPGTTDVELCDTLSVTVPQGTTPGVYPVAVTNPTPAGCSSQMGPQVTVFGAPEIATVTPASVCSQAPGTAVILDGQGFVTSGGVTPSVTVGGASYTSTAGNCSAVMGTSNATQLCTSLSFTLPQGALAAGNHPLVVTNPGPIGCASSGGTMLEVTPPPTISSVAPTTICAGGDTLTITGTGFTPATTVSLINSTGGTMATAQTVTVASSTSLTAVIPGGLSTNTTGTPYTVRVDNQNGCADDWGPTSDPGITVVKGPQIFFVDPPIVYNGINTIATVYGTGFTGTAQYVRITHQGTGAITNLTLSPQTRPNQVQVLFPQSQAPGVYDMTLKDDTTCETTLASAVTVVSQTTFTLATPSMLPPFGLLGDSTGASIFAGGTSTFQPVPRVYLNPVSGGTVAAALGSVSIVNATTLSALVPGTLPAGKYDLIVVNPDATVGFAAAAFEVVTQAPPVISTVSPGSVINSGAAFDVIGQDFRAGALVSLTCFTATGAPEPAPTLSHPVPTSTVTTITVTVGATSAAACVVRVTNTDGTYADFSALVFTNPSQNLYPAQVGPSLAGPRRAPAVLGGDATSAARFLHVVGGDPGTGAGTDVVETSPLTLIGVPGPFFQQRNKLNQGRTYAAGVTIGRWLYVVGGSNEVGGTVTRLNTVERSWVLDPEDRVEITDLFLDVTEAAGLDGGLYYYRVSAVMGPTDPFNPNGENLASDPFPVQLPTLTGGNFHVTLKWATVPGATKYRVYRSTVAGAAVGTEEVIAEPTATTYTDTGTAPIVAEHPLPIGSLGRWQTLGATLSIPREGAGVAWGLDPADATLAYLYVIGGRSAAGTVHDTYEYLTLTLGAAGAQTPAASFTSGGATTLGVARWQLSAANATNNLSPVFPAGETWIYAGSGMNAGATTLLKDIYAGKVQAGGALGNVQTVFMAGLSHAGYALAVAADLVIALGGSGATPKNTVSSGVICGSAGTACTPPPKVANFNTGQSMLEARYLNGGTLHGAYLYVVGGVTATAPLTVSSTTEYRIW